MSDLAVSNKYQLEKYNPPVQQPVQQTSTACNGMTDLLVRNSKGEEFVFSGKNLLQKGDIENINIFGEKNKVVKTLDSEGEKGPEIFNAGMLGAMFGSVTSIASSIGVSAIPGIPAPVKFALVAGSSLAVGAAITHFYIKENVTEKPEEKKLNNKEISNKGVVIELKDSAKRDKAIETGFATGMGAFVGGAFGFFTSVGLANTAAFEFGPTVSIVSGIGAVAGGALGYFSAKPD
jgi:hypothetical protein